MIFYLDVEPLPLKCSFIEDKRSNRLVRFGKYFVILVATLQLSYFTRAQAQTTHQSEIVFHTMESDADAPVKIVNLKLDGKTIPMDTPVRVGPGWLSKFVVVVKNLSRKTVVEGGVQIDFPETGSGTADSPILATTSKLGQYPSFAMYRPDGTIQALPQGLPIKVAPGSTLDFPFPDASIEGTEAEAQRKVGQVTRVNIKLLRFYFEDSSFWMRGEYFFMPDTQPGKWKRVTAQEFMDTTAE